jgi:hypothetical protein
MSNTQVIQGQKYSTAGKKGNNSIDMGSRATNPTQNMTNISNNKFGNSTQYVSRAYTQSPASANKMNTIQPPNNLNISELYKQYAQKSFIAATDGSS